MEKDNITQIVEQLTAWLRNKVSEEGMSQARLAKQAHCTHSRINDFINPKKKGSIKGAGLDLILRLFPELQRPILTVLESHDIGPQRNTRANVINNNFGSAEQTYNEAPRQDADTIRAKITDLAVSLADDNGTLPLAPFLKKLREVK